jgi:hypothetical protein
MPNGQNYARRPTAGDQDYRRLAEEEINTTPTFSWGTTPSHPLERRCCGPCRRLGLRWRRALQH